MPGDQGSSNASIAIGAKPYQFRDPATLPRREWLSGGHLIRGFVSATVAPGGIGKTSLLIGELLSIVSHRSLLGARLAPKPLRGWLWNLEDPIEELQRRIQAGCLHHGLTADDLGDRLHVNDRETPLVVARTTPGGSMVVEPVVDALIAEIKARNIDVLVIDPFVSCHQAAENDNSAIDAVVKAWG
ncbi:MAG: ATP-binding protein, partial [Candidatus Saccharimonadales bacterium]